jgi:hypothetical protein
MDEREKIEQLGNDAWGITFSINSELQIKILNEVV